ncbi:MAG: hypothetical protein ACI30K_00290 [Muribaculaceae bacterium]
MAKSDYRCELCDDVVGRVGLARFFSLTKMKKYSCQNCGTICKKHVKIKWFKPICKKCGKRVLKYSFYKKRGEHEKAWHRS